MDEIVVKKASFNDSLELVIAREIAMDLHPLEKILGDRGITPEEWDIIRSGQTFQSYLRQCTEEWNSAINTAERVRLKSLAFVEEVLPEFFGRAHDRQESLSSKVEILKTVSRIASLGSNVDGSGGGERLSVTINLGADHKLHIEKELPKHRVIDGDLL